MKHVLVLATGLSLVMGGAAIANTVDPGAASVTYAGAKLAPRASITLAEARVIAVKARPGQITDQELETEGGGSGLRYSFDIKTAGKVHEVGVDARSGRVLENKAEGPNPD